MVIPLKNTIQIKSYGKPAAIAALKSRIRRLWRNLKSPTSSKGTVLFGVEWGYTLERTKTSELQGQYLFLLLVSILHDSLNQQQLSPYTSRTTLRNGDAVFTVT